MSLLPDHQQKSITSIVQERDASPQMSNQSTEALKDIVFGSFAGTCGKVIEYPFDTVKVRLQSQPITTSATIYGQTGGLYYTGPIDCFRKSLASSGVRGLYRGVSAPLVGAAVETSSLFFSYRLAQEAFCAIAYPQSKPETASGRIELPLGALILCGAASGAFTSVLLTPIELVKCQLQAEPANGVQSIHRSPISVMKSVWKHHGLLGFWRGQMGTLIRESGGSAAWFGSYEGIGNLLKKWYPIDMQPNDFRSKAPIWHQLIAGACAGMSYNFLFYPADTIKSRIQTEQIGSGAFTGQKASAANQPTFWSVGRDLWRDQGVKGMYRGCGITVARSAPSSAIIFAIFEWLRGTFA